MRRSQLGHQVGAVVAGVVRDDDRQLDEKRTGRIRTGGTSSKNVTAQFDGRSLNAPSSEPWRTTPWRRPPFPASCWPNRSRPSPSASQSSLRRKHGEKLRLNPTQDSRSEVTGEYGKRRTSCGRTSSVHGARLLHGLRQHAQSVVQRALRLVQDLLSRSAQDHGARLT